MKTIFDKLYQFKTLDKTETFKLFNLINSNKLSDVKLAAILVLMKIRGETTDEILGAIQSFSKYKKSFNSPNNYIFSDITGTGSDKSHSINVSTISAIVAASCGFKIAKHCNYNITGKIGSSNFLEELGIDINISSNEARKNLDVFNICFLLAPLYYKGFKFSNYVRTELQTRTIFNLIGPLLNPANPIFTVIGVYKKCFMIPMAKVLKELNYQHAILINSQNTDEVTLQGHTDIVELKNNMIISYKLHPIDFGFKLYSKQKIIINSSKKIFKDSINLLKGIGSAFHEETIAANVAILLKIFGNENIKENAAFALQKIRSGKAYQLILKLSNRG